MSFLPIKKIPRLCTKISTDRPRVPLGRVAWFPQWRISMIFSSLIDWPQTAYAAKQYKRWMDDKKKHGINLNRKGAEIIYQN